MATYIPNITDAPYSPLLNTPDYAFLRYTIDKKQARYDEGLDAVSKAYNSLKRNLTDPVNKDKRDEFLKNAQGQLQKIAASDLSLAKNVSNANDIFTPLATDKAILFDAYTTDRIARQNEIMNEWANSSDPEIRKQYNSDLQKWMNRDLDVLRNGKGDINNYKGVQGREAKAYIDPQDVLLKAAKDYGFEYKYDTKGQPYIVTTEGGKEGIVNYKAFAESVLGGNSVYQDQLKILSQNDEETILENYKKNPEYANKSNQEIFYDAGLNSYDAHRKSFIKYIESSKNNYNIDLANLEAFKNANGDKLKQGSADIAAGNNGTDDAILFNKYSQQVNNLNGLKSKIATDQSNFNQSFGDGSDKDENRIKYAQNFSNKPQSFYADQRFKNDIQRFADIKASSVNVKISPDTAYVNLQNTETRTLTALGNMMNQITDNETDVAKLEEKQREFNLKLIGKKVTKNADGTTTETTSTPDITVASASSYVLQTFNALNKIKEEIQFNKSRSVNSMTDASGGALNILASAGMSNEDVGLIKLAFSRQMMSGDITKSINFSSVEEKNAFGKAIVTLRAMAKNANIIIPNDQNINPRNLPELLKKALPGFTMQNDADLLYKQGLTDYFSHADQILKITNEFNNGKKAIAAVYGDEKAHPEFTGMFVKRKDENGKEYSDLIGEEDITKEVEKAIPNLDKITKQKIVNQYLDGTLKTKLNVHTSIGGGGGLAGSPSSSNTYTEQLILNDGTKVERYIPANGFFTFKVNPDNYKKLTERINSDISVPSWTDNQGIVLASPRYILKPKSEAFNIISDDLSDSSQTNSNIWQYVDGTDTPTQVENDNGQQKTIRNKLANKDNIDQIQIFTGHPLNKGGTVVAIKLATKYTGEDNKKKEFWEGMEYLFPINMNSRTPKVLSQFATTDDVGDWAYYKKTGQSYEMNTFEADGIKAIIHPNAPGDNVGKIDILYKQWNPVTKSYSDNFVKMDNNGLDNIYDENAVSINEIKNIILQQKLYPYVKEVIARKKEKNNQIKNSNSMFAKIDNMLSQLKPF